MIKTLKIFKDLFIEKTITVLLLEEPMVDQFATQEVQDEARTAVARRLMKCQGCPFYNMAKDKCANCGCFMKIKTGFLKNHNPKKLGRTEITHCPLGQWIEGELEIVNEYRKLDKLPLYSLGLVTQALEEGQLRKDLNLSIVPADELLFIN